MSTTIEPDYWVCSDCLMVLVNGDESGVPDDLLPAVREGVENFPVTACYVGNEETDRPFDTASCDCCRSRLAGNRHAFS